MEKLLNTVMEKGTKLVKLQQALSLYWSTTTVESGQSEESVYEDFFIIGESSGAFSLRTINI